MAKQPEKTEAERWREIADQYRNEASRLGTAVIELEAEVQQLLAELAAAKAASVVPVEKYEIGINYKNEVTIYMHSRNDAESAFKWLQGCMKDTPPTT